MRPQPMIVVNDVPASSRWYQSLLNVKSGHGGDEYEQLVREDGTLILQLHHWDVHEHPFLGDPEALKGNGALLWFEIDDFTEAVARANSMSAEILDGPLVNPNAQHRELWVRDPDGYTVVLATKYGDL
ncbi:VOC family protein [Gimesia chilikensis]|uniref:Glyoxalase-like domain protein n=1 Tax=Gimesia chilikensis TaxID=2605989 RepID=A0A517WJ05_9PLAN|nr:VOC family protein [Gimesia chilikensis]MBN73756.1 glyoxalase/bleomycin resistance/extradiol dioxygenase family protein [Gimesia sp.]MCR9234857.1 VOC family protein [bacterium]QDT87168.1 Glyoxalase-like domain protein [Gimesia chilikensis]QDU05232.1 Glyoxalase-like domain protein [Gimesia chilikensis]